MSTTLHVGFARMHARFGVHETHVTGLNQSFVNACLRELRLQHDGAIKLWDVRSDQRVGGYDVLFTSCYHRSLAPVAQHDATVKVYYTPERMHRQGHNVQMVRRYCDFLVGFTRSRARTDAFAPGFNTVRLPLWLHYWKLLNPDDPTSVDRMQRMRAYQSDLASDPFARAQRACFIATNPNAGRRMMLVNSVRQTGLQVDCLGRVGRNVPQVLPPGGEAKWAALERYVFNVCPENENEPGYVTEKLVECSLGGCIPIWWGDPHMEPAIINPNRVIRAERSTALGARASQTLRRLLRDRDALLAWWKQPPFAPTAVAEVERYRDMFARMVAEWLRRVRAKTGAPSSPPPVTPET